MKKLISMLLLISLVFSMAACGSTTVTVQPDKDSHKDTAAPTEDTSELAALKEQAAEIDAAIHAIGTVTLESAEYIATVRAAYDSCDAAVKEHITALSVLEEAENTLSTLYIQDLQNQAEAVNALICAIGTVTLNSGDAIAAARTAYNNCSEAVQCYVTDLATLESAEQQFKTLRTEKGKQLLKELTVDEDFVRNMAFYYPDAFPWGGTYWYADQGCFVLPYMGKQGDDVWLRLVCNLNCYSWIFFEKITYAVDDQRFYDYFSYWDVVRDNSGGEIWEYVDIEVGNSEIEMLWAIANSERTIVRFEGDDYYYDFTVSDEQKASIRQILEIYELLS